MAKFFTKHLFFWLPLAFLFIFLRLPSLFEPDWYGDEGIYLALGQGINRGLTLYSQIHDNKPPLLYFFAALSQSVFGFRLLLFLYMVPTIYFFYRLSRKFFELNLSRFLTLLFLLFTSIPFLEGNIANAEIFMLLPTIIAFLLIYHSPHLTSFFFSGLLLGIAFTIKVPVAFEFAFLCLWLIFDHFDFKLPSKFKNIRILLINLALFISAFLLPIVLWGVHYYFKNSLPQFVFASLLQNFGYLASWSTGSHTASASQGGVVVRGFIMLFFWVAIAFNRFTQNINRPYSFLLFWFSSTVFASLLSGRPYPHYLIQVIPPALLLFGYLIHQKTQLSQKIILSFIFITTFFIFQKFNFYSYPTLSYYKNYYSYFIGQKTHSDYLSYFGNTLPQLYQTADYLKKHSQPEDKLFVWGDSPFLYPLSGLLPSGRYTVAYHILDFHGYDQTMGYLKTDLPLFIVYLPQNNRPFPQLDEFVRLYYYPDAQFGKYTIFKLRQ